jgi:hypothetical protein
MFSISSFFNSGFNEIFVMLGSFLRYTSLRIRQGIGLPDLIAHANSAARSNASGFCNYNTMLVRAKLTSACSLHTPRVGHRQ